MKVILSQRIDIESNYDDLPFSKYHFPKRYVNQVNSGDRFIYYQGNRSKREHRYYFGWGVIGTIEADPLSESFYAEILEGHPFTKVVPIYLPSTNGFIESLGYEKVRNALIPPWQSSIRKISDDAFFKILSLANINQDAGENASMLEAGIDPILVLQSFNNLYAHLPPKEQATKIQNHLDRGNAITKALKSILGAKCQVCNWSGFRKKNGDAFIEAHHIVQLSEKKEGSLCVENILLLCPNCHREIHYGKDFLISQNCNTIEVILTDKKTTIRKNTMENLLKMNKQVK